MSLTSNGLYGGYVRSLTSSPHRSTHHRSPGRRPLLKNVGALFVALSLVMLGATSGTAEAKPKSKVKKAPVSANAKAVVTESPDGIYRFPKRTTDWTVPPAAAFKPCFEAVECATVLAPMNYADKRSPMIELNVTRRKARDQANRIGIMFVNPGGPGGGTSGLVRFAERIFPAPMIDRFDIIGLDPRGTEKSTPVLCESEPNRRAADYNALLANYTRGCAKASGQYLKYVDTVSSATDHDWVRQALGEAKANYLGFSYGGYLGAMYAQLFPQTLRTVILDSGLDNTVFGTRIREEQAGSRERTLLAFLKACSDGTFTPCAFNDGTDLVKRYEAIQTKFPNIRLLQNPASGRQAEFEIKMYLLLSERELGWPKLAEGLLKATTSNFPEKEIPLLPRSSSINLVDSEPFFDAYVCRDGFYNRDPAVEQQSYERMFTIAPHMTGIALGTGQTSACLFWPVPALAQPPIVPNGIVPVLLIGSYNDMQTPYQWQVGMQATTGGVLVSRNGSSHGAIPDSKCVADFAVSFVIDVVLPPVGSLCAS